MHSVGIDLHRSRSRVAVINEDGDVLLSRRIVNDPATFLELLAEIDGECRIALEATFGWEWLADVLQGAGYELHRRIRSGPRRSPQPGSRPTPSTPRRSRTCCAPTCCLRPISPPGSCGSCATFCATGWR
jgi:hypothetical protein